MIFLILSLLSLAQAPQPQRADQWPITVAERSNFEATARYDDVVRFIDDLTRISPVARSAELGVSVEGRSIPLVILADPPLSTSEEANKSGKLVVLAFGNIHAGEVCGKEALLMLARDIAKTPEHPLLKELVIVFAPIFNTDGNERMSKDNRPGQNGPIQGMGQRANAQQLDLNRDYVKLDTPEVRSLVRFMNAWDPAMIIDTHTTNGSYHQYTITYAAPRHPAGDAEVISFVRDKMLPDISESLLAETGYKSFFYGNFDRRHAKWESYAALPRFGTPYRGLRNRIAILSEAYSYAPYRDRVLATRDFVSHCLRYTAEHHGEIRDLLAAADRRTIAAGKNPRKNDTVAIRSTMMPFEKPVMIEGFVEKQDGDRRVATGKTKTYEVQHFGRFTTALSVHRPFAYLFPQSFGQVVEKLQQHGIEVEELREDVELDLEVYTIEQINRAEKVFQKHSLVSAETSAHNDTRLLRAGTILVRTAQKLGTLAIQLLEPQSEDGLLTWNLFDRELASKQPFPVLRLPESAPMTSRKVRPLPEDRQTNQPITFEAIYELERPPSFGGNPVSGMEWVDDEHFLQVKEDRLWKVHAATGRCVAFHDPDKMARALAALPGVGQQDAEKIARRTSFKMNPDRSAALIEHEHDLFYCRFDGTKTVRLTRTPQGEELYSFSPDGATVAFVREHDLFVVDIETQKETELTTDGDGIIRNGKFDWVYFEELNDRQWQAYCWSPDSTHLAFLHTDDGQSKTFTVIDEIPVHQDVHVTTYPKAGDPNPLVKIGVVSTADGAIEWVDLDHYDDFLISRFGWKPDGESIYFYVQDRAQTWLDFCVAARTGGKPTKLFRETTQAWVNDPGAPSFLSDASFILPSERTGWRHLFHFSEDGRLLRQITQGDWDVRKIEHVDEKNGRLYLSGTRDSHVAHHLYRIDLNGGEPQRLTQPKGHHRISVSPEGKYFMDTVSDRLTPPQVRLMRTDGSFVRTVDSNPAYDLDQYRFGDYTMFQIPMSDGFLLEASIIKPPDFDAKKKYPVWFVTYGGPGGQTVWDSWSNRRTRERILAELGFIVFRCDPRSAGGKGAHSAWTAYKNLGACELEDIIEAIQWLISKPFVDAERMGMSGHSYGGFMTAYAMTHCDLFAAGIAGAPVTDWRNYDTIYTERLMDTPQNNPAGYDASSVIKAAGDLHGKLLILHGVMDDNVHFQNTLQFAHELQKADKQFEMMLYPQARHGLRGKHYNRLYIDFVRRTLGEQAVRD